MSKQVERRLCLIQPWMGDIAKHPKFGGPSGYYSTVGERGWEPLLITREMAAIVFGEERLQAMREDRDVYELTEWD